MKRLMSVGFLFVTMMMVGCMDPSTVSVTNQNPLDSEDGAIRVWIVQDGTELPTTKAEAAAVGFPNVNSPTFPGMGVSTGDFNVNDYTVVAANEEAFQGLADDDPIAGAVAIKAVSVADGDVFLDVVDGEDSIVPVITEGSDPFEGDGE